MRSPTNDRYESPWWWLFFCFVVDILLAVEANDDRVVGVEGLWINNTRFWPRRLQQPLFGFREDRWICNGGSHHKLVIVVALLAQFFWQWLLGGCRVQKIWIVSSLLRLHFLWFNRWFTWGPNMRTREAARLLRRLRARDAKWILKPSLSSSLNNGGRSRIPRPREEAKAPCGVVQTHYTRVASSVLILRGCSLYVYSSNTITSSTYYKRRAMVALTQPLPPSKRPPSLLLAVSDY